MLRALVTTQSEQTLNGHIDISREQLHCPHLVSTQRFYRETIHVAQAPLPPVIMRIIVRSRHTKTRLHRTLQMAMNIVVHKTTHTQTLTDQNPTTNPIPPAHLAPTGIVRIVQCISTLHKIDIFLHRPLDIRVELQSP
jgi:hypothetical protein